MPIDGRLDVTVVDDTVEFAFTVTNTGTDPVDLEFQSSKMADIAVFVDDIEIWRWSDDKLFTQAIKAKTLTPGQKITRDYVWKTPSPGEYVAVGTLEAQCDVTARMPFTI